MKAALQHGIDLLTAAKGRKRTFIAEARVKAGIRKADVRFKCEADNSNNDRSVTPKIIIQMVQRLIVPRR